MELLFLIGFLLLTAMLIVLIVAFMTIPFTLWAIRDQLLILNKRNSIFKND